MEIPPMDEILREGQAREGRALLVLGILLTAGGLAFLLGIRTLTAGMSAGGGGVVAAGIGMTIRALFARRAAARRQAAGS